MVKERLSVVVTRRLPTEVETRLSELFDVRLREDDTPMDRAELVEATKTADVLVPTITDIVDASVIGQAGDRLKLISNYGAGVDNIDVYDSGTGGSGIAGQGHAGGSTNNGGGDIGGSGGGAGEEGYGYVTDFSIKNSTNTLYNTGGSYPGGLPGGHGLQNNFRNGSNTYYAGGGAGGSNQSTYQGERMWQGGNGGGGDSVYNSSGNHGSVNTGGGGAGSVGNRIGGNGGSGIVVIRYVI